MNVIALICTLLVSSLMVNVAFSRQMVNYQQKTVKFGNSSEKLSRVSPQLFHVFKLVASKMAFHVLWTSSNLLLFVFSYGLYCSDILYLDKQRVLAIEELNKAISEKNLLLEKIKELELEKQALDRKGENNHGLILLYPTNLIDWCNWYSILLQSVYFRASFLIGSMMLCFLVDKISFPFLFVCLSLSISLCYLYFKSSPSNEINWLKKVGNW